MLSAIIVDDEPQGRQNLKRLLESYCPEITVVGTFGGSIEAHHYLLQHTADVVFLDIDMPQLNGFDFLNLFPNRSFQVVFVTAHEHYALQAFKAEALDYLLKPPTLSDLRQTVARLLKAQLLNSHGQATSTPPPPLQAPNKAPNTPPNTRANSRASSQANSAGKAPTSPGQEPQRLALPTQHGFVMLPVTEVMYFEADNNYTWVVRQNGERMLVSKPLKEFERQLDPTHFVRIHKSQIIHLAYLAEYTKVSGGIAVMTNGQQFAISRRKLPAFMDAARAYSLGQGPEPQ